jgi:phosphohistidine swiveling domain-containing protein
MKPFAQVSAAGSWWPGLLALGGSSVRGSGTVSTLIAGPERIADREDIRHQIWRKVLIQAIKQLPILLIREINKKVGFMLLSMCGSKRALVSLVKGVPLVGGAVDATMTSAIGRTASAMFPID